MDIHGPDDHLLSSLDDKIALHGLPPIPHRFSHASQDDALLPSDDLEATLHASELRLSAFLEERSRLARDLHDTVLQSLYAIGLAVETARRGRRDRSGDVRLTEGLIVDQLNRLIHQVRGMIRALESGTVEEFDLPTELETLISTYARISPIRIDLQIAPDLGLHLTREEKEEILNIAREALSNCVRHAKATHAGLFLTRQGSSIRLLIRDDGIGFETTGKFTRGYGLLSMAARARKLGGHLLVSSDPGRGTLVDLNFTLEPVPAPI